MVLFKVFLIIHIIAGALGLISGTMNVIRKKGDSKHRLVGRIFLYSMLTVGVSALVLSVMHTNYFLFIVGIFTLYMVSSGQRYLFLRQLAFNQKPTWVDWTLSIFMLVFGLVFIVFGILKLSQGENFGIVFIVFGVVGLRMVTTDFKNYRHKTDIQNSWLVAHIQRMTGAYVAALTAFLVVNIKSALLPGYVVWLLPTAIFFPLILTWTKKYQVKKKVSG